MMAPKTLVSHRMHDVTDWSGIVLRKRVVTYLRPGCIVRVIVQNTKKDTTECLYFKIVKMKDGTFWGECKATYRQDDWVDLADGKVFTFRSENISEIPISWQPKWFRSKLSDDDYMDTGYSITGYR